MKTIISVIFLFVLTTSHQGFARDMSEIGCRHVYAKALTRFNDIGRIWLIEKSSATFVPEKFNGIVASNDAVFSLLNGIASHNSGHTSDISTLHGILRDIEQKHLAISEQLERLEMNEYLFISGLNDLLAALNQQAIDLDLFYSPHECGRYAATFEDFRLELKKWMGELGRMAAFTQLQTTKRHKLVRAVVEGKKAQLKQEFAKRQNIALDALEASLSAAFVAMDFQAEFETWNSRTSRPVQALIYDARQYHEAKMAIIGHIKVAQAFRSRVLLLSGLSEENKATLVRPIDTRLAVLNGQLAETEKEGWKGYQLRQKQFLENVIGRRTLFNESCLKQAEAYLAAHEKAVSTLDRRELDVQFISTKIACGRGAP